MIFIKFLHIGIDDTDSPNGMCTTYLGAKIIDELKENKIEIEGFPRLIRLNPFARFKTRGNGAIHFKIPYEGTDINFVKELILKTVSDLAMFDCDNTNPGVVFYSGEITPEMIDYSYKAIHSVITIKEAENFAKKIGADIYKFKKGRGIIGSLAAIGCPLKDYTYELLAYRIPENYGTKRAIDYDSVIEMDKKTFPDTFENYDKAEDYIAIEPKTPCPVMYGIRSNSPDTLLLAKKIVKLNEPIERFRIYLTNQHTDMHVEKAKKIEDMKQYSCYIIQGKVKNKPKIIEGGHMFFNLYDESGEIACGAYEPTKDFRKVVKKLLPEDIVKLYGGIGEHGTFNIEKFQVIKLIDIEYKNPKCKCGKRMTSAGKNKGFKCKKCGNKISSNQKVPETISRSLVEGKFYETPISARRHLAKPIVRMNL